VGIGRIPGPYGIGSRFGCILNPGPLHFYDDSKDDSPHLTPGPVGTGNDRGTEVAGPGETTTSEDENELKLLVKVYKSVKNKKGKLSYSYGKKKKRQYRVAAYVKDRDKFFGSMEAYQDYRDSGRDELDADDGKLRAAIEPSRKVRKKVAEWKNAQDVFYAWVRKAYQNLLGDEVDIPKLIKSGMSEKLKAALQQVKIDYGEHFRYGGFNPRPMKMSGGYRLGTISEHAIGTAVDVESAKNAHIETDIWNAILRFTGKSVDNAKLKWKTAPRELYDAIKEINDEFVSRLGKLIKETEEAAQKSAEAPDATAEQKAKAAAVKQNPLAAAIKQNADLQRIHEADKRKNFLKEWRNGFFTLPWELVQEFHEEGFLWGATFSHPDLHHFEL
jgi:hypothetical protein